MENKKGNPTKLGFGLSELSESFFLPMSQVNPEKQVEDARLSEFCNEVFATLHSVIQGYSDILSLSRDYSTDSGKDPYKEAVALGFKSFREFMHSEHMKKYVIIGKNNSDNEPTYCAAEIKKIEHIRKEQIETYQDICKRRQRREGFTESKRTRPKLLQVAKINDGVSMSWDSPPPSPIEPVNFTNKKVKQTDRNMSGFESYPPLGGLSDSSYKQRFEIFSVARANVTSNQVKEREVENFLVSGYRCASASNSFFSTVVSQKEEDEEEDDERFFGI